MYVAIFCLMVRFSMAFPTWTHAKMVLKGQCHEMDISFEGLNILISTLCVCADGFQDLPKAFHYSIQWLTFNLLLRNYLLILNMLTETLLRIPFSVIGQFFLHPKERSRIRDPLVRDADPDPHQNVTDPQHWPWAWVSFMTILSTDNKHKKQYAEKTSNRYIHRPFLHSANLNILNL